MILIDGDSWGCGEWHYNNCSHPGLEFYLKQHGLDVVNFSKGGSSNADIADRLEAFFKSGITGFLAKNIDLIFVFQTQWFRDLKNDFNFNSESWSKNLPDIFVSKFYYRLSAIAVNNDVRIGIIGGCSDTLWLEKFEQEYPGLFIACQSMTELLINQHDRISEPNYWGIINRELIEKIKKFCRTEQDLEHLSYIIDICQERLFIWRNNPQYFFPDGIHPNRQGHQALFQFMKSHNFFLKNKGPK
jgi:lysophospholipase L1-like esterase